MSAPPSADRARRLERLRGLYAIVGDGETLARVEAVVAGGAGAVQLRMKAAPAGRILEVARRAAEICAGRALLIVNDRADLALLSGADGVHLGDDDLPAAEARRLVGPALLVGRTCRTAEAGRLALEEGADHLGYGPVFPSSTKPLPDAPRGLAGLAEACAALPAPVVAISGIALENIGAVAAAGAAAAAVIGDLFGHGDPRQRAAQLAAAFAAGARERR